MTRRRMTAVTGGVGLGLSLFLAGCSGSADSAAPAASPTSTPVAPMSPAAEGKADRADMEKSMKQGGYISLADYEKAPGSFEGSDVVLFFNASWCPTCQEATEQLTSAEYPDGLTVVSVDYDSKEALRDKYGVTTQHTFVVIDSEGRETKKFSGATDVATIQENVG